MVLNKRPTHYIYFCIGTVYWNKNYAAHIFYGCTMIQNTAVHFLYDKFFK